MKKILKTAWVLFGIGLLVYYAAIVKDYKMERREITDADFNQYVHISEIKMETITEGDKHFSPAHANWYQDNISTCMHYKDGYIIRLYNGHDYLLQITLPSAAACRYTPTLSWMSDQLLSVDVRLKRSNGLMFTFDMTKEQVVEKLQYYEGPPK